MKSSTSELGLKINLLSLKTNRFVDSFIVHCSSRTESMYRYVNNAVSLSFSIYTYKKNLLADKSLSIKSFPFSDFPFVNSI